MLDNVKTRPGRAVVEPPKPATVEDMYQAPRDGRKYELVEGEVKVTPAGIQHEFVGGNLFFLIRKYLHEHPIGQAYGSSAGFVLPSGDLLSPDVSFVRAERLPNGKAPEGFGMFAPDLAVEIVSPGDQIMDVEQKVQLYLSNGTQLVWVLNPRLRRTTVYRPDGAARVLQAQDALEGEGVLPGFRCALAEVYGE